MFNVEGSYCVFPRAAYAASDLPGEYHAAVRARFLRACRRDILQGARSREERRGLEERCEEIASTMLLHWYGLRSQGIARGDHGHAVAAVIKYFRLTGWHGMTGYRRSKSRKTVEGMVRARELARERSQPTPEGVAMAKERIGASPALARKAYRLAERSGIPGGVPELLQTATLAECSQRGTFLPQPTPVAGMPAVAGDRHGGPGSGFYRQGERKAYVMSQAWFEGLCSRHGIE